MPILPNASHPLTTFITKAEECYTYTHVQCAPGENSCVYGMIYLTIQETTKWGDHRPRDHLQWVMTGCYREFYKDPV